MRARAKRAGILTNDWAFGVNEAGALDEARLMAILEGLPEGVTEVFFHPATGPFAGADRGTERYQWAGELAALTSARVRAEIERNGIELVTYGELANR